MHKRIVQTLFAFILLASCYLLALMIGFTLRAPTTAPRVVGVLACVSIVAMVYELFFEIKNTDFSES